MSTSGTLPDQPSKQAGASNIELENQVDVKQAALLCQFVKFMSLCSACIPQSPGLAGPLCARSVGWCLRGQVMGSQVSSKVRRRLRMMPRPAACLSSCKAAASACSTTGGIAPACAKSPTLKCEQARDQAPYWCDILLQDWPSMHQRHRFVHLPARLQSGRSCAAFIMSIDKKLWIMHFNRLVIPVRLLPARCAHPSRHWR